MIGNDHGANQKQSIHKLRPAINDPTRQVTTIRLACQCKALTGNHSVNEIQDNVKHLIRVGNPFLAWGLSHAGQIRVNALPSATMLEDRLHAPRHKAMIGRKPMQRD